MKPSGNSTSTVSNSGAVGIGFREAVSPEEDELLSDLSLATERNNVKVVRNMTDSHQINDNFSS
jgi:hypothetical protein